MMCTLHEILRSGKIKAGSNGWGTKHAPDGYMLVGKHEQETCMGSLGRGGKIILKTDFQKDIMQGRRTNTSEKGTYGGLC
jgi:hypothetical protein